ncbi:MAG TPA: tyrosinase family protein [Thermoanaerobaculia bacterium]|nr:tyrosinase family protein [Thermoanaerobaculia bacterium]
MKRKITARRAVSFAVPGILLAFVTSIAVSKAQTAALAAKPVKKPVATVTVAPPPQLVALRMKFQDFVKDPKRLDALNKAIGVMKTRSSAVNTTADYRRSWEYWSAMHGFYGPKAKAGLLQDAIDDAPASKKKYFNGLRDLTYPPTPVGLAAKVWDQCQHGTLEFLTWHRMFLFYFEKTLQAAAGDPSLHLPYWDYTDPTQLQLPAQFAQPTLPGGKPNPLFDVRRRSQTVKLDSNATNIDNLLKQAGYTDFGPELEQQPHGYAHCTVGPDCPYPLMGDVPVAGTDPIFWLHHANIDRIFECWLKLGGTVPNNLKNIPHSFVDGTGTLVTKTYATLPIDYAYDHTANCGRKKTLNFTASTEALPAVTSLAQVQSFQINGVRSAAKLPKLKAGPTAPEALTTSGTELVLSDITLAGPPGVLYNVYLSTTGTKPRKAYVATVSFFGVNHHGHGTLSRKVDVTEALNSLKGKNGEVPDVEVTFEATDGREGTKPESLEPVLNKKAGLKVGKIQLQVKK